MVNVRDKPPEKQREIATRIIDKYPTRLPVLVYRAEGATEVPLIDKHKFLVPKDITLGQMMIIIRRRVELRSEQALFLYVDGIIPVASDLMGAVYKRHVDPKTLFLTLEYAGESVFGHFPRGRLLGPEAL